MAFYTRQAAERLNAEARERLDAQWEGHPPQNTKSIELMQETTGTSS